MAARTRFVVLAALLVAFGGGWGFAQAIRVVPVTPIVLSGEDVGFRVEGHRGDVAVGKLVVRVDGEWLEANLSGVAVRHLTSR